MAIRFEDYKDKFVAIELLDGSRIFGFISKWSRSILWIEIKNTKRVVDIPRDIIERVLVIF